MVKIKGSVDLHKRKGRSDRDKKREFYAGKKTHPRRKVNGRFVTYKSNRRRGDPLKVEFWKFEPMSHEGYMNWHKSQRRKVHPYTYGKTKIRIDILPEDLSTKDKISEIALEHLSEGTWLLMLRSHAKNKYQSSPKAFARIKITDHTTGMKCNVYPSYKKRSLRRFWFWEGS